MDRETFQLSEVLLFYLIVPFVYMFGIFLSSKHNTITESQIKVYRIQWTVFAFTLLLSATIALMSILVAGVTLSLGLIAPSIYYFKSGVTFSPRAGKPIIGELSTFHLAIRIIAGILILLTVFKIF